LAFVREAIRQGKRDWDLTAVAECWAAEFLVAANVVRRVRLSNLMFEGFGRLPAFSKAVETGTIEVEDHSHLGLILRLAAGAWGMPFLPIRSMAGTDLAQLISFDDEKYRQIDDPFGGAPIGAVSALTPDVAIIHADVADEQGNCHVPGTLAVVDVQARAARTVIVTAERLVPTEAFIRRDVRASFPGMLVDTVVVAPFGAHPGALYGGYDEDEQHLRSYYALARKGQASAYLSEYVFDVSDHSEYLRRIGSRRLMSLRIDPSTGHGRISIDSIQS
jgi:acyl CoA:acetate/3-ketoacid CoA transferase alpha subunit